MPKTTGPETLGFATTEGGRYDWTLAFDENYELELVIQNEHINMDTGLWKTLRIISCHSGILRMNELETHRLRQFSPELSHKKTKQKASHIILNRLESHLDFKSKAK